jgi:hypothetical protein
MLYGGRGTAPRHGIDILITRRDGIPEAKHMSCWTKTAAVMLNCGSSRWKAVMCKVWTSTGTLECWICHLSVHSAAADAPPKVVRPRRDGGHKSLQVCWLLLDDRNGRLRSFLSDSDVVA